MNARTIAHPLRAATPHPVVEDTRECDEGWRIVCRGREGSTAVSEISAQRRFEIVGWDEV